MIIPRTASIMARVAIQDEIFILATMNPSRKPHAAPEVPARRQEHKTQLNIAISMPPSAISTDLRQANLANQYDEGHSQRQETPSLAPFYQVLD